MSDFVIMDDETLRRIAHIVGPQSAAARALAEAEHQRKHGVDAVVGSSGNILTVCSRRFAELRAASGMSAFGQDAEERLEAKPASPTAESGDAYNPEAPNDQHR